MRRTRVALQIFSCALLAGGGLCRGGERTDIQGMGMARTYVSVSRGLDAVGINPANLALPDDGTVTFSLVPIGVHVGSDFLSYGLFTRYFNGEKTDSGRVGRYLTDADKQSILNAFPGGTGTVSADAEVRLLGLSVDLGSPGRLALSVSERMSGDARMPDDYVRFLFYGNAPGSNYDFSRTRASASWTREYSLSFGTALPRFGFLHSFAAGVAVKLVHGFGYYEVNRFDTRLLTSTDGTITGSVHAGTRSSGIDLQHDSSGGGYSLFPDPAGSGVGFDIGVSGELTGFLRGGLSVTDIGSIRWSRNVVRTEADTSLTVSDPTQKIDGDAVDRALRGKSYKGGAFSSSLPTTLRAGVAVDLHKIPLFKKLLLGEMVVACDYNQGISDAAALNRSPRVSFGMEYRPWGFLPLRTGISFGGPDHTDFALGIGLHFGLFDLDLASENLGWLFSPGSFSYGSVAMGMLFRL